MSIALIIEQLLESSEHSLQCLTVLTLPWELTSHHGYQTLICLYYHV